MIVPPMQEKVFTLKTSVSHTRSYVARLGKSVSPLLLRSAARGSGFSARVELQDGSRRAIAELSGEPDVA
jgi:hypothetical protein